MNNIKIGFIGIGAMGGALAKSVSKTICTENIYVSDKSIEKSVEFAKHIGAVHSTNEIIAAECDYIFLGVKPQIMPDVLEDLQKTLSERTSKYILVTMAAGISIAKIQNLAGLKCPVIRIMPNTPASIGQGTVLYAWEGTSEAEVNIFKSFMKESGRLISVPESLIDSGSAVSGCGPAFVFMFIESLADGGVACGLPRSLAIECAANTVLGSAAMLLETGEHPEKLKDMVCSPGGSTIEGVKTLEDGAFRASVINAVENAYKRTKELGKYKLKIQSFQNP